MKKFEIVIDEDNYDNLPESPKKRRMAKKNQSSQVINADNNIKDIIFKSKRTKRTAPKMSMDFIDLDLTKKTFNEKFDLSKAIQLVSNNPRIINDATVKELSKYIKAANHDIKNTRYKFGKDSDNYGRLYNFNSLQHLPRKTRNTIAHEFVHDLDVVNCHPKLLTQKCKELGFSCPLLLHYVEHRDLVIDCVMKKYNVDRYTAKDLFIRLLNGGTFKRWMIESGMKGHPNEYIKNLINEISILQDNFWMKYPRLQNGVKRKTNPKASLLARVLNAVENEILTHIVYFVENRLKRNVNTLVFDGCMVERNGEPITDKQLTELNEFIFEHTGLQVKVIEKSMNDYYILPDKPNVKARIPVHLTDCENETQAAKALLKLHGKDLIKYCDELLYVYDQRNGMWNSNDIMIRAQLQQLYDVELGDWVKVNCEWKKLFLCLKVASIDNTFLEKTELSSIGKTLFKNGIYDWVLGEFTTEFNPEIFFPFRLEYDYNPEPTPETIQYVNKVLFIDPFATQKTGVYVKQKLARSMAGTGMRDKNANMFIGFTNSGKGVLTGALLAMAGKYASTFDGELLVRQKGYKEAALKYKEFLTKRYCRILLSNELDNETVLDGTMVQKLTGGGDTLEGRHLYGAPVKFIPQFVMFFYCNDKPRIVPFNDTEEGRIGNINYPYQFTTKDVDQTMYNLNFRVADTSIKDKAKEQWFIDALFHILTENYLHEAPIVPAEIIESSKDWNEQDDFISMFLKEYDVTGNDNHTVKVSDIVQWAKNAGLSISGIKVGLQLKKLPGVEKINARRATYKGLKKHQEILIEKDNYGF